MLTPDEAEKLLITLAKLDPATERVTRFCMLTGCRLSEAAHVAWAHVDLTGQTVCFAHTKNKDSRVVYLFQERVKMPRALHGLIQMKLYFHAEMADHLLTRRAAQIHLTILARM